jgi:hypothetical protein
MAGITTEPGVDCRFGSRCTRADCRYAHASPAGSGMAGDRPTRCRYATECTDPGCEFAHPSPAFGDGQLVDLGRAMSSMSLARSDNQGDNKTLDKLLANLRDIFSLDQAFVRDLKRCLLNRNCKILLLFVDLDNVPRFFQHITSDMIASLPFEAFVICSANLRPNTRMWQSAHKIHFTLALPSKDAADAVCTVAMSKLDSVLVAADRQDDVVHVVVSDDRIFEQVCTMSGSVSICHQKY